MSIKNIEDSLKVEMQAILNICKAFENLRKVLGCDIKYRRKAYKKVRFRKKFKRMKEV